MRCLTEFTFQVTIRTRLTLAAGDNAWMPTKHGLGFGNGRMIEYEDGTVAYCKTGEFTQAFRVSIADVQSFSVVKSGKMFERTLNVLGAGTVLASVSIPHACAEKIEEWFRRHPQFRDNAPVSLQQIATAPPAPPDDGGGLLIADELRKLAALRDEGILTESEFAARKQLLLDRM